MQSAVLERPMVPEAISEELTLITVPDALPMPVQDGNCPQGGDHDWQGDGDKWRCSKCGATATIDS